MAKVLINKVAFENLLSTLRSREWEFISPAAKALKAYHDPRAIPALFEAARNAPHRDAVLVEIAEALASIGDPARPAVAKALCDPSGHVRYTALLACEWLMSDEAIEGLRALLRDPDRTISSKALRLLNQAGDMPETAQLVQMSRSPHLHEAIYGLDLLFGLGGPEAIAAFIQAAHHSEPVVRVNALHGLYKYRPPETRELLLEAVADYDSWVQAGGVGYLQQYLDAEVIAALVYCREQGWLDDYAYHIAPKVDKYLELMNYPPNYQLTPQERTYWSEKYGPWRKRSLEAFREKQIRRHEKRMVSTHWPKADTDIMAPDTQLVELDIIEMFLETNRGGSTPSLLKQMIEYGAPKAQERARELLRRLEQVHS